MTALSRRAAIEAHFETNWLTTAKAWPNIDFDVPDPPVAWVRLTISASETMQASMGTSPLERTSGAVTVQVFTPVNEGPIAGDTLADSVAALFRDSNKNGLNLATSDGDIQFRLPHIRDVGVDGSFYQHNVEIEFFADARIV